MTPDMKGSTEFLKFLKDIPLWLLIGLAITSDILYFSKLNAEFTDRYKLLLTIAAFLFTILAFCKGVSVFIQWWKESTRLQKTFHLTPMDQQCHWSASRQKDGSTVIQISTHFLVKNVGQIPLGLADFWLLKPKLGGEILHKLVCIRAVESNLYSSDHVVPPGMGLPASIDILIRCKPPKNLDKTLRIILRVINDEGNKQKICIKCKAVTPPKESKQKSYLEPAYKITDLLEKKVVSTLQSELNRYEKCDRQVGGLGSVHFTYLGRTMVGVGSDHWQPNSPKNQSIISNPEAAILKSDNLEALLKFYENLTEEEKNKFAEILINRLNKQKGYLSVAYFIVCVLWKIGRLEDALRTARENLPQGETEVFGLSNVLLMLNGLLHYRHSDFSDGMLDDIERFIDGLGETTFRISERVAAIRTYRIS